MDSAAMFLLPRAEEKEVIRYVNPYIEMNVGLWTLFGGATVLLVLRLWTKIARRHRLWYDDHILAASWCILLANNILIIYQFATGYILKDTTKKWDDRMHIFINISSCGTLIGQALTKTAFGVTLLRLNNRKWQVWVLWFCIGTMNLWMLLKVIFQWAKVCNDKSYQNWYRLDFCIGKTFRDDFKEGGNVWNIIMDFVFACFPWVICRGLDMRKVERIGLCATMSLGMIVAIISAVRVAWKDDGNKRDAYYIFRNGVSQVWYTSEITGTIMVQCIPILRPLLRDLHTTMNSRRLSSTVDPEAKPSTWGGSTLNSKRASARSSRGGAIDFDRKVAANVETKKITLKDLREIPEESASASREDLPSSPPPPPPPPKDTSPISGRGEPAEWRIWGQPRELWPMPMSKGFQEGQHDGQGQGRPTPGDQTPVSGTGHSFITFDFESSDNDERGQSGLRPPPRRT